MLFSKPLVEFYLIDSFEINHYQPIWEELIKKGVKSNIVAEKPKYNTAGAWFDYESTISILKELKIPFKKKANPNTKVAITTQFSTTLSKYKNLKVRLNYGVGLNKNNFVYDPTTNQNFDFILSHGAFTQNASKEHTPPERFKIIGYPLYERNLKTLASKEEIRAKLGINTDKPVLGYFPTWDDDNTISLFQTTLQSLKQDYFILSKPHHCTARLDQKKQDLEMLNTIADYLALPQTPLTELFCASDLLLIDAKSGCFTEALLTCEKTPLIGLTPKKDIESYFYPPLKEIAPIVNNPDHLTNSIEKVLHSNTFYDAKHYWKTQFYTANLKNAASTAADAIIEIATL